MKKIFTVLLVVLMITLTGCDKNETVEPVEKTDAEKVKEEYESLNDTVRESDKEKYNSVSLRSDNVFKYINSKEALELLNSDEAIIYVGAGWCPWCRSVVSLIDSVAKDMDIKTIYYLNLDAEKSMFAIKNGKLEQTKKGTDDYYKLLDALKDCLSDYNLEDENKKVYKTGEKRIYIPYMLAIKDKKIVANKDVRAVESGQSKYASLTDKQVEEVTKLLKDIYGKVYTVEENNVCSSKDKCD